MIYDKKVNLAKLLESLDLGDDDDIDVNVTNNTDNHEQPTFRKEKMRSHDFFTMLVEKRFLNVDDSELNPIEKKIIEDLNEKPDNYIGKYKVENYKDLQKIIFNSIKYIGNEGNYNWIDTTNVTSLQRLFMNLYQFNGDITKWNTSNVVNMLSTFEGATSFNRDLSSWDVTNVKYINAVTFKGTDRALYDCFKKKKYPNKITNFS